MQQDLKYAMENFLECHGCCCCGCGCGPRTVKECVLVNQKFRPPQLTISTLHIAGRRQKIKKTVESVDVGVSAADVAAVVVVVVVLVVVVVVVDGPVAMLWILPPASVGMWPQT